MSETAVKCKAFSTGNRPCLLRCGAVLLAGLFFAFSVRAQDDGGDAAPTPKRHHHHKAAATDDASSQDAAPSPEKSKKAGFHSPSDEASPTPKDDDADAAKTKPKGAENAAPDATLATDALAEFKDQPGKVRKLLESALDLTTKNLTYTYGSADPAKGGMDCSGFMYYILQQNGFTDAPRSASEQYVWLRKADLFHAVLSEKPDTFELDALRPGDILFWTGTYSVERDPPITHSMLYLGTLGEGKRRVMAGSSDGRTYDGKARWGVSVFDFILHPPSAGSGASSTDTKTHPRFVGYARLPGIRD